MDASAQRLLQKVTAGPGGCWIWTGCAVRGGGRPESNRYGQAVFRGRRHPAHVASYLAFVGEIPDGYQVHHRCEVKLCIRPGHLAAVTPHENLMASDTVNRRNATKTQCLRGHALDATNTARRKRGNHTERHCRRCDADRQARRRAGLA
jgi:hypothetical protein